MAHEVIASIRVELSDDPTEMVAMLGVTAEAWANMLKAVGAREQSFAVNEVKARPGPRPGTTRKPRIVAVPQTPDAA
jgi:hypothetical protein